MFRSFRVMSVVLGAVVASVLLLSACGGDEEVGENRESGEEGGEHDGDGDGDGGEGGGEHDEGGEGRDGEGLGEAAEGGVVNLLTADEQYDETRSGARLILSFDVNANEFTGTVENTTDSPLTRARVEVHLSNGTELGPTTPTDLAPGETITVNLPSTEAPFETWSAHPEVGSGDGEEDEHGATAESRGVHTTQVLAADETYAGKLNDLELAVTFDPSTDSFIGRVRNEATQGLCNTTVTVVLDSNQDLPDDALVTSLAVRGRAEFTFDAQNANFTTWEARTETFACSGAEPESAESEQDGEGEGHEGGEGSEGEGHEGGEEGGEETSPSTPIDQAATGNFNSLDYEIAYDASTNAFRGVVVNNANQTVCGARLEIHMAKNGQVIELGPTINLDLATGEALNVVLSAAPIAPDTYSLHPESSPCS